METFDALKTKISHLIEKTKELKAENIRLVKKNEQLVQKLESIEVSVLQNTKKIEVLNQEKTLTKAVVDDLIKSIDSLMGNEKQS